MKTKFELVTKTPRQYARRDIFEPEVEAIEFDLGLNDSILRIKIAGKWHYMPAKIGRRNTIKLWNFLAEVTK